MLRLMGVIFPTAAIESLAKELASVVSRKGTGPEGEDPQASKLSRNALAALSSNFKVD